MARIRDLSRRTWYWGVCSVYILVKPFQQPIAPICLISLCPLNLCLRLHVTSLSWLRVLVLECASSEFSCCLKAKPSTKHASLPLTPHPSPLTPPRRMLDNMALAMQSRKRLREPNAHDQTFWVWILGFWMRGFWV